MSWLWFSILSVTLVLAVSGTIVIFLISRAPRIEDDGSRRFWVQRARPAKLGHRFKDARMPWRDKVRPRERVKAQNAAGVDALVCLPDDVPQTIEDAARQLLQQLTENERELLRDPADASLCVKIRMEIHDRWCVHNPHSEIRFDAEENYEAYDPDAISGVIIEAAQGLLSVGSNSDFLS